MDLIRQELKFYTPSGERVSGFSETTDVIVPDSYPDFDEAVFSGATITVKDELKQPGRVLISGQIDTVILYRCFSQEGLYRLNIPLSFAHVEEAKGFHENTVYFMKYDISQIDIRIINSRKISVTCTCVICPKTFEPSYCSLACGIQDADPCICTQLNKQSIKLISAVERKRFVVLDDLEISKKDEQTPIHTEVLFEGMECTVGNGRIILNGSAILGIWEKNEDEQIIYHHHNIPFHQILESETLCDNVPTRVLISCHSIICHYSNSEILSVNINTEALFLQETEHEISYINDLYDLNRQVDSTFQPVSLSTISENSTFSCSGSETLTTAYSISDVISTELSVCSMLPSDPNDVKCILSYSILYHDDSQKLHHLQKQQPVTLHCNSSGNAGSVFDLICTAETTVQDKQITVRLIGKGYALKCDSISFSNLEDLSFSPCFNNNAHSTKILFIDEPTSLWQIAKKNLSTVQLITQYNELPENTIEVSHTKLLVP